MNHAKIYTSAFLMALWLVLPCHASSKQDASIRITAPNGYFMVNDASIHMEFPRFARFKGFIVNKTGFFWSRLDFAVTLHDKNGHILLAPNGSQFKVPVIWDGNGRTGHFGSPDGCLLQITSTDNTMEATGFDIAYGSGEYKVAYGLRLETTTDAQGQILHYKDGNIDIVFDFSSQFIHFTLSNRTEDAIRIEWEKSSYYDTSGVRHRIMHEGIPFAIKDKPQEPTTVEPHGKRSDIAFPADNIVSAQHKSADTISPLLPEGPNAATLKGKTIGLDLAVKTSQSFKTYHFSFLIDKITPLTVH